MEAVFYNFCGPGHVTLMANNVYASCGVQLGGVKINQLEEIVTWFFPCFFSLAFQTVQEVFVQIFTVKRGRNPGNPQFQRSVSPLDVLPGIQGHQSFHQCEQGCPSYLDNG